MPAKQEHPVKRTPGLTQLARALVRDSEPHEFDPWIDLVVCGRVGAFKCDDSDFPAPIGPTVGNQADNTLASPGTKRRQDDHNANLWVTIRPSRDFATLSFRLVPFL